jgi:hypothetical protein
MRLVINDGGPPFKLTATMLRTFGDVIIFGEMAGARFYQPALARLACMRPRNGFPCVLLPQPANPHDANAIAIWTRGGHVGYIPRLQAPSLHPALAKLEAETGTLIAIPGSLVPSDFGLDLMLEFPEELRG